MFSVELMRKIDEIEPDVKLVLLALMDEIERKHATERKIDDLSHFVKTEIGELKGIVRELAEAQKRTEQKVGELTVSQKELADAQRNTENEIAKLSAAMGSTR
jgi:hypothetical protein